jgi:hypothetical protein
MYRGIMLMTSVIIPGKIPAMFPMRADRLAKSITDGSMMVVMVCLVPPWAAHEHELPEDGSAIRLMSNHKFK